MEHEDSPKGATSVLWEQRALCPGVARGTRNQGSQVAVGEKDQHCSWFPAWGARSQAALAHEDLAHGSPAATRDLGWGWPLYSPASVLLTTSQTTKPQWGPPAYRCPHSHFSRPRSPTGRFHYLETVRTAVCLVGGGSEIFSYICSE